MKETSLQDVGFRNFVDFNKVLVVCNPESNPVKRFVKAAKANGTFIDLTEGKKTRSIIVQEGLFVIASCRLPKTVKDSIGNSVNKIKNTEAKIEAALV